MRICYVFYHEYGRMPIHTVEVIEELDRQGHRVTVATAISPGALRRLGWPARIRVHRIPIVNLPGLRMLSFFINALVQLPCWCLRDRPEMLYGRFSLTTLATVWVSRVMGVPLVVEVNGIISDELALSGRAPWRLRLQAWLERRVFHGCDHVIAVTEGIRHWMHTEHGVPLGKMTAIPNGTNPMRFRPVDTIMARREFGFDPARPVVGYLGSLFPWCGLELLVDASPAIVERVPDVLFAIGGGQADLKAALERRVRELGMPRHFRFEGDIPVDRAASFISAFDVAVAPARFANPRSGISPQKVYAYLACERPVVGSDLEGLGDLLTTQGVGLAFPAGDVRALAEAVVTLLQDRALAGRMGQRGRQVVLERFTWERVVSTTVAICQDALDARRRDRRPAPAPSS